MLELRKSRECQESGLPLLALVGVDGLFALQNRHVLAASAAVGVAVEDFPGQGLVDQVQNAGLGGDARHVHMLFAGTDAGLHDRITPMGHGLDLQQPALVAGTYLCAAAITGGEITLRHAQARHMTAVLQKLREMGCDIWEEADSLALRAPERLRAFDTLQTQPHPGFPTDMQSPMLALASVAQGCSVIVENVFENRFALAGDLNRMGANIRVAGRAALIQGVGELTGVHAAARDLRSGAALVLAALAARGESLITGVELIDRGYAGMEERLAALGGCIRRVSDAE